MAHTKAPLIKAVDIAAASKAFLLHVQGVAPIEAEEATGDFCGTSLLKAQMAISPMLLALSMELALKAWIIFDGTKKDAPKSHDLSKLFKDISSASQERLRKRYDRDIAPHRRNGFYLDNGLEHLLESAREAFVQWRYVHELVHARFETGIFMETIEMVLSEFEKNIVVKKYPPPFARSL